MINLDDQLNQFEKVGDKFSKLPLYLTDFHGSQVNIKKFLYGGNMGTYLSFTPQALQ